MFVKTLRVPAPYLSKVRREIHKDKLLATLSRATSDIVAHLICDCTIFFAMVLDLVCLAPSVATYNEISSLKLVFTNPTLSNANLKAFGCSSPRQIVAFYAN